MPPGLSNNQEPNQGNIRQWMDNLYSRFQPIEQARWNQANIDSLFYAGSQEFINRYFGFNQTNSRQNFYFNLLQQPVNMVTGYQRQHRKQIQYIPSEGADPQTTDQYNRLMTHVCNTQGIHEQFSRSCEQSCITGLSLMQPYLDYTTDPAQGDLKLKVWEYNSFIVDPFARDYSFEDAQFIWCQEYISKFEAQSRFPDKAAKVAPMAGSPQRYGSFYFLPENYNMSRNDLLVLSYIWYRSRRKKKQIYSEQTNQFFDFDERELEILRYNAPGIQIVDVEVPTWKLATVLNDQMMYNGLNPLGFDTCPFIPTLWNYEPHLNYYDLRCRGLVRTMRDSNYLLNRRIIINHDISEATVNAGWKRKIGAVANEDNLKKSGQGWDIIINQNYELTDIEKIIPTEVPQSDMALADQLQQLIFSTSGINLENWSAQDQVQASSLTVMLKQAANLMVLQKYFDQWDLSLKLLGDKMLKIILNNWSPEKVQMIINDQPTDHFYSKIFCKYQVTVEEGLLTPTQQNQQAQQMLEINQLFGREVFPPSMIVPRMNLAEKAQVIEFLQQQEQQMQAAQGEAQNIQHAFEEAKLKEMMSKAVSNLAQAREKQGRAESNIGLLEERLSEVSKNQSLSVKAKMESIQALMDTIAKYGEVETALKASNIESYAYQEDLRENQERMQAKESSESNKFLTELMGSLGSGQQSQPQEQNPGMQSV